MQQENRGRQLTKLKALTINFWRCLSSGLFAAPVRKYCQEPL